MYLYKYHPIGCVSDNSAGLLQNKKLLQECATQIEKIQSTFYYLPLFENEEDGSVISASREEIELYCVMYPSLLTP